MADDLPETLPQTLEESHALLRQLAQEKADLARRQREAEQAAAQERARAQHAEDEVARLKKALKDFVRRQQGRKSEQLDPEQYALGIDDIEENIARAEEAARNGKAGTGAARRAPRRNQGALPKDLPRYEVVVEPEHNSCPCCGGELHVIDETKTEQLDAEPAKVYVKVIRRPTYGCRSCEGAPVQAEAPASPVDGGLPTCGTVAQVLTAKYADALPLYRQAEMLARQGIEIDRSTLARWAGTAAHHLRPVHAELMRQVMASTKLFADETPAPTLEKGKPTTRQAYLWAYGRDDTPWNGPDPPAVVYRYATGRGQDHPARHLKDFTGTLQVDGYRAYNAVAARRANGQIVLAHCWAHIRRPIYKLHEDGNAPTATEALQWIAQLYAIEDEIRGCDPETRRAVRQAKSKPLLDEFHAWLEARLRELSPKSDMAKALKPILTHWQALTVFLDDGRVELDTNSLERQIKPAAIQKKNFLFAGNTGGGHTWAIVLSLTQTCKLNGVDPQAYLADVLERIVSGRAKTRDLPDLMPWNWAPAKAGERG
jgi:transposase